MSIGIANGDSYGWKKPPKPLAGDGGGKPKDLSSPRGAMRESQSMNAFSRKNLLDCGPQEEKPKVDR